MADASGAWSFTPASPLAQGAHTVTAAATDAAGNTSPVSSPRDFVVDSVAPAPPEVLTPTAGATVSPSELSFSGRTEANSTVIVMVDGLVVGTTRADASSAWSLNSLYQLAQGQHTVSATARDGAGNVSEASAPSSFTVMEPPEEEPGPQG
ncbi:MAG TPA: Ig-like domain-containing protein [Archangium sp.]|nr:Ig-like domain-containing protein [Archangium sp.]